MLRSAGSLGKRVDLIQRTLTERYNRASSRFDATDAQTVRPYTGLLVPIVRPNRASPHFDATDARPCVPTQGYSYRSCVPTWSRLALMQRTHDRASLHRVTRTDRASVCFANCLALASCKVTRGERRSVLGSSRRGASCDVYGRVPLRRRRCPHSCRVPARSQCDDCDPRRGLYRSLPA